MTSADAVIKLRELLDGASTAFLTSRAPDGELHARPLAIGDIDDDANLSFIVEADAGWVEGLNGGESVNLSISDESNKTWVSIAGSASVTENRATVHRLWNDVAAGFIPAGPDSSTLRVLTVTPTSAEYWDAPSSAIQRLVVRVRAALGDPTATGGETGSVDLA